MSDMENQKLAREARAAVAAQGVAVARTVFSR